MGERHPVEKADIRVTEAVADTRHTPLVRAAGFLSEAADQPPLRIAMTAWLAVGLVRRDPRLVRAGLRMAAAHTLATWVKSAIKARVDRTRPDHALATRYRMEKGGTEKHELSSFPSGHTAGALAVTQALTRDFPETRAGGLAASAAVAAVQVPRAKHFVSDVAVGAAIGWAAEQVTSRALDWGEARLRSAIVEADADAVRLGGAGDDLVAEPAFPKHHLAGLGRDEVVRAPTA